MGYSIPEPSWLKNSNGTIYPPPNSWGNKGVHTFSKGISPKVNVIAWLEFELTTML